MKQLNQPNHVLVDPAQFVLVFNRLALAALVAAISLTVAKQEEAAIAKQA